MAEGTANKDAGADTQDLTDGFHLIMTPSSSTT